jgi:hypothetical protein
MTNQQWKFPSIFSDKTGKVSAMRTMFLVWTSIVLAVWVLVSWRANEVQDLPTSVATIIAALGVGKSAQRFAE